MNAGFLTRTIISAVPWLTVLLIFFFSIGSPSDVQARSGKDITRLLGKDDALLIASPDGEILLQKNAGKKLIPASTLKIFTSLAALHYLGPDYRFVTEFYGDQDGNLKVKGYGDPLLVSETLRDMARVLLPGLHKYNDLVLDDSYFQVDHIPGTESSHRSYDAPNGALSVNFNTVNFKRVDNRYVSAEEQTPLLPFALDRVKVSGPDSGRIVLSHRANESTLYAGHLLKHFLTQAGIASEGKISIGLVHKSKDRLLATYTSTFSLEQNIVKLLKFSNNFIANQLLLTAGAKAFGPPATLDKGVRAALAYAERVLNTGDISYVEGSGISRDNRISARTMLTVLDAFAPYRNLMRRQGAEFYKTGMLDGVRSRAGYLDDGKGKLYRFVIIVNRPGKASDELMTPLHRFVASRIWEKTP